MVGEATDLPVLLSATPPLGEVRDNREAGRFELEAEGHLATLEYKMLRHILVLVHTDVPPELEGRGVGGRLVQGVLETARERGTKIFPACPFVHAYIRRHPEYLDLVSARYPRRAELEGA